MLALPLDPPSNFVVSQSHVQGPKASSFAGAVESPTFCALGVGSRPAPWTFGSLSEEWWGVVRFLATAPQSDLKGRAFELGTGWNRTGGIGGTWEYIQMNSSFDDFLVFPAVAKVAQGLSHSEHCKKFPWSVGYEFCQLVVHRTSEHRA